MSLRPSAQDGRPPSMRVAFLAMQPPDNVATRLWCVRPSERMAHLGVTGRVFPPSSTAVHARFYRRKSPGWRVRAAAYWYLVVLPRRFVHMLAAARYDIVFLQRGLLRWNSPPFLERLLARIMRRTGGALVYHLDDALWAIAPRSYYETRCALADRVVTGNRLIEDFARSAGAEVSSVEYGLDVHRYTPRRHEDRNPAVIGYCASAPEDFLWIVADALRVVCERTGARVKVVGGDRRPPAGRLEPHMDWEPWSLETEYSLFDEFDIGIVPIDDSELNRGKEPFKVKEYMAAGLPVVASRVGHNLHLIEEGSNGLLVDGEAEWIAAVEALVRDASLRKEMGAAGRRFVEQRYEYAAQLESLAAVFNEVVGRRA